MHADFQAKTMPSKFFHAPDIFPLTSSKFTGTITEHQTGTSYQRAPYYRKHIL